MSANYEFVLTSEFRLARVISIASTLYLSLFAGCTSSATGDSLPTATTTDGVCRALVDAKVLLNCGQNPEWITEVSLFILIDSPSISVSYLEYWLVYPGRVDPCSNVAAVS
jgi:hypothetical protein